MEEDYVMIPGTGTKKIIRDVKKEIETEVGGLADLGRQLCLSTPWHT